MSNLLTFHPGKISFDKKKKARISRQKKFLEDLQNVPKDERAERLFDKWPRQLPNYIFDHAPSDVIDDYMIIFKRTMALEDLMFDMTVVSDEITEEEQGVIFTEFGQENEEERKQQIEPVLDFLKSLNGVVLTINSVNLPLLVNMKEAEHFNMLGTEDRMVNLPWDVKEQILLNQRSLFRVDMNEIDENTLAALKGLLASVIVFGGGVHARAKLPLKVMRKNEKGQQEWFHQEKIYGFMEDEGALKPLSTGELRACYCTDHHTGETLPLDFGTHVGNTVKDFEAFLKSRKNN